MVTQDVVPAAASAAVMGVKIIVWVVGTAAADNVEVAAWRAFVVVFSFIAGTSLVLAVAFGTFSAFPFG